MDRNPLAEVPEPAVGPAKDEGHGDGDSSNDMDIDGTDGEDMSELAMEFASENQAEAQIDGTTDGEDFLKLIMEFESANQDQIIMEDPQTTSTENLPGFMRAKMEEENMAFVKAIDDMKNNNIQEVIPALPVVEPPAEMLIPLLSHQKEWLSWALLQEDSPCRGGILADEVGMGKTIQAIALVLKKRSLIRQLNTETSSSSSNSSPTLVVCPLASLKQWQTDIAGCTPPGSVKVLVYHGPKRKEMMADKDLSEYDFVLTTYSIAEIESRKYEIDKLVCDFCGQVLDRENMKFHGRFLCKQSNQVSTPEMSDIRNQVPLLSSVRWERIILDEAHAIKSKDSRTTKAIMGLESTYKWALTGTLLEDSVKESHSLIRFLRVFPFAYTFCWFCYFTSLDNSDHPANCPIHGECFSWWNTFIDKPRRYTSPERRRAKILFTHKVLKSTMLRRTKGSVADDAILPYVIITTRWDSLDKNEENYYQGLFKDVESKFKSYTDNNTKPNYHTFLELITPLREALDHLYLVEYSKPGSARICAICISVATDRTVTYCGHTFCKSCLVNFIKSSGNSVCPTCSLPFTTLDLESMGNNFSTSTRFKSSILGRISLKDFQTSTKIDALREEIRTMVERDGSAKGIVITQFTSFLDLIRYSLYQAGVNCVVVVSKMTAAAKDGAIKRFNEDPDCRIFLTCMKSGAAALNLPLASNVFTMEPWLNFSKERQVYDRIYRIGQHKMFRIVRFVIRNSIEARILWFHRQKEIALKKKNLKVGN